MIIRGDRKTMFHKRDRLHYSVFIPCYNEERRLAANVKTAYRALERFTDSFTLTVVDDSSTDGTEAAGRALEQELPRFRYLLMEGGPSRRENLASALAQTKGDIVAFMDLDLSTDLSALPDLLKNVDSGADIVIGSRYIPGARIKRKIDRQIISIIFNTGIRILFRTGIKDHECGFKAWKRDVIRSLVKELGYDRTGDRSVFWDTEMLVRARMRGYKIKEIPVTWTEGPKSALRFKREKRMVGYIIRLWFRIHDGRVGSNS